MNEPKSYFMNVYTASALIRLKAILFCFYLLLLSPELFAQAPTHLPQRNPEPVDLSPERIIFFIGLPIIILLFYIIWRIRARKK
jgi:hypothetical protein